MSGHYYPDHLEREDHPGPPPPYIETGPGDAALSVNSHGYYHVAPPLQTRPYVFPSELIAAGAATTSPGLSHPVPGANPGRMVRGAWGPGSCNIGTTGSPVTYQQQQQQQQHQAEINSAPWAFSYDLSAGASQTPTSDHQAFHLNASYHSVSPVPVPVTWSGQYMQPPRSMSVNTSSASSDETRLLELDAALDRVPDGSSIYESNAIYLEENNRTYHKYKSGAYWLPNDAPEQDRLDFEHHIYKMLTGGKLGFAPVEAPKNVLDIATGTGIWAIEFAEENPSSQVIGIDLTAIQPIEYGVPNCRFEMDDAEEEWVDIPMLDYVHARSVCTCFQDRRRVMQNAFDNLNSGGWLEYQDMDIDCLQANPHYEGTSVLRFCRLVIEGASIKGRDLLVVRQYKQMMTDIGFVDVHEKKMQLPFGPWMEDPNMKELGQYMMRNLLDCLRGPGWVMLRARGLCPDEIDALIAEIKHELRHRNNKLWCWVYFVWGRKP